MELSRETTLLQAEIRKFAKDLLAEKVDEYDKKCLFPLANIKKLAEMGILGAVVPEGFGGVNLDTIGMVVVLEELSRVCPSTGLIVAVHNALFSYPIVKFGAEELKKKYLPQASSGEIIGGFGELATNEAKAKPEGDNYRLNGKNPFGLNAASAGPFVVIVPISETADFVALVVDANAAGVQRENKNNIIGMKAAGINEVIFNNCLVPRTVIIGEDKKGRAVFEEVQNFAQLYFSAIALGISEAAMEHAIKYAKERLQFGQAIINFGMIRELIADIATKIETARLLIYDAAMMRDAGKDYQRQSAMARYFASQSVVEITTNVIQIYGGYGYMKDYPVERYFRDAQVIRVLCGSSIGDKEKIIKNVAMMA